MNRAIRSKYGVRLDASWKAARTVDGILFDSLKEARRYSELKLWQKSGGIRNLITQPCFPLLVPNGIKRPAVIGEYRADFSYDECDHANGHVGWKQVVEDVKGFKTPLYRWKKKHVEAQFGITIREV